MVFDEDAPDEFRPPPHPDDRLWRHPSELRGHASPRRTPEHEPAGARSKTEATDRRRSGRKARREHRRRTRPGVVLLSAGIGAAAASVALILLGLPEPLADRQADDPMEADPTLSSPAEAPSEESAAGDDPSNGGTREPGQQPAAGTDEAPADIDATERAVVFIETAEGRGPGVLVANEEAEDAQVTAVTSTDVAGHEPGEVAEVTLSDGRSVEAQVEGADVLTNIAVLSLPEDDYPAAPLEEGATRSGSEVSLVGRLDDGSLEVVEGTIASSSWRVERSDLPALNGLLQIGTLGGTAEPGGPVVNAQNRVVGIIAGSAGGWYHATPIDVAAKASHDILRTGEAQHARLGIEGNDVAGATDGDGDATHGDAGVYVSDVFPDSPAASHLQEGDVIVTLGGVPVTDIAALQTALLLHRPGDEVEVTYYRDSDEDPETATAVTLDSR